MSLSTPLVYFKRVGSPIVGVATATGGPVAVIRVSGRSLSLVEPVIGKLPNAGTFEYRKLKNPNDEFRVIEHALILRFVAPASFTGEDVVEIQCHGVPALVEQILQILETVGVQRALPGEFSFRALINEKMSLPQAEALHTALSFEGLGASAASRLLSISESSAADVSGRLDAALQKLVSARGRVEAAIDFPEAEAEQSAEIHSALEKVKSALTALSTLLSAYENFCSSAGEARVALIGEPNAGKSTLFNQLVGGQRALVSSLAGTTRDVLEARIRLPSGRWVRLMDTAGIRQKIDETESDRASATEGSHEWLEDKGMMLGLEIARSARLVLRLQKAGENPARSHHSRSNGLIEEASKGRPILNIESFRDLDSASSFRGHIHSYDLRKLTVDERAQIFEGIDSALEKPNESDLGLVISARQGHLVAEAVVFAERAKQALEGRRPLELAGGDLLRSEESLLKALGRASSQEYIGEIFSQFCLGK